MPRTCHIVSNILAEPDGDGGCTVTAAFVTHLFKRNVEQHFFGRYHYRLARGESGDWLIRSKKIVVLNALIDTVLDVYSV
jgi:3-phenylpropionate/cinnamic acid dioxygenase small subunit